MGRIKRTAAAATAVILSQVARGAAPPANPRRPTHHAPATHDHEHGIQNSIPRSSSSQHKSTCRQLATSGQLRSFTLRCSLLQPTVPIVGMAWCDPLQIWPVERKKLTVCGDVEWSGVDGVVCPSPSCRLPHTVQCGVGELTRRMTFLDSRPFVIAHGHLPACLTRTYS